MPKPEPVIFGNLSDKGQVREENEDYFASSNTPAGLLFIVADGMGGEVGGKVASRTAVEKFNAAVQANLTLAPAELLSQATFAANQGVLQAAEDDPSLKGMGTTLDALLVRPDGVYFAHVGDSRIYRVRAHVLEQITRDQTLVQQMVDGGLITPAQAAEHPERHVLTQALGKGAEITPQFGADPQPMAAGEVYLLCSDGLTDLVTNPEILAAVHDRDPQDACADLIQLANSRGGHDNITIQVVRKGLPPKATLHGTTVDIEPEPEGLLERLVHSIPFWAGLAVVAFLIGFSLSYIIHRAFGQGEEKAPAGIEQPAATGGPAPAGALPTYAYPVNTAPPAASPAPNNQPTGPATSSDIFNNRATPPPPAAEPVAEPPVAAPPGTEPTSVYNPPAEPPENKPSVRPKPKPKPRPVRPKPKPKPKPSATPIAAPPAAQPSVAPPPAEAAPAHVPEPPKPPPPPPPPPPEPPKPPAHSSETNPSPP